MTKEEKLRDLVKKNEFENLDIPYLKAKDEDNAILKWIVEFIEGFDFTTDLQLDKNFLTILYWLTVIILSLYLGIKIYQYVSKKINKQNRLKIKNSQTLFSSSSKELKRSIEKALNEGDIKKAMKLKWILKLKVNEMDTGQNITDILGGSQRVKDLNKDMFSPSSEASRESYKNLSSIKMRRVRER